MGENALKTDELENGHKRSIKRGAFNPDKFNVVMRFDWTETVTGTDKNEFQLFQDWYKYRLKYGSVPFEFPKILYSPDTGIYVNDSLDNGNMLCEYYKITSAVPGQKSGNDVEVNMTWETVYGGTVNIETPLPAIVGIEAHYTYVDIYFSEVSDTAPTHDNFILWLNDQIVTPVGFCYDGSLTARIYYQQIPHGTATIQADYAGLYVPKNTFISTF